MIFVYLLAIIGLLTLLGLAAAAVLGAGRSLGSNEPSDSFDLALTAVSRLRASAWKAIQELRALDGRHKEE